MEYIFPAWLIVLVVMVIALGIIAIGIVAYFIIRNWKRRKK